MIYSILFLTLIGPPPIPIKLLTIYTDENYQSRRLVSDWKLMRSNVNNISLYYDVKFEDRLEAGISKAPSYRINRGELRYWPNEVFNFTGGPIWNLEYELFREIYNKKFFTRRQKIVDNEWPTGLHSNYDYVTLRVYYHLYHY